VRDRGPNILWWRSSLSASRGMTISSREETSKVVDRMNPPLSILFGLIAEPLALIPPCNKQTEAGAEEKYCTTDNKSAQVRACGLGGSAVICRA